MISDDLSRGTISATRYLEATAVSSNVKGAPSRPPISSKTASEEMLAKTMEATGKTTFSK